MMNITELTRNLSPELVEVIRDKTQACKSRAANGIWHEMEVANEIVSDEAVAGPLALSNFRGLLAVAAAAVDNADFAGRARPTT